MMTRALAVALLAALTAGGAVRLQAADPLPSWNDGPARRSVVAFVENVTREGATGYVPPAERIAVFDNDGTLWSEQPMYFQAFFIFDRIKALAPQHPEWKDKEPFASVLKGDVKAALAGGEHALLEMAMATHAGTTTEEFDRIVADWIATAKHPKTGRLYTEMVYQPMLELLAYLRANGFKTFIVSGGGIEFMRPWAERVYGIPPGAGDRQQHQDEVRDARRQAGAGAPARDRTSSTTRRASPSGSRCTSAGARSPPSATPTATCRCCSGRRPAPAPASASIVHHTDAEREWAYDRQSTVGRLDKGLDEARAKGWTVVDMKTDWKRIYP